MTAVVDIEHSSVAGAVVTGVLPLPLTQPRLQGLVHLAFRDFHFLLTGTLIDFKSEVKKGYVKAKVAVDENVFAEIELRGNLNEAGTIFQHEAIFLQMKATREVAQADFVASSFTAMLGLAEDFGLQIPDIEFNMTLKLGLSLLEISRMLQRRQLAYRLMIIEKATGLKFDLPARISDKEMESIAFIYHAIVERSFAWPDEAFTLLVPANQAGLDILSSLTQPISLTFFSPHPISKFLFGNEIILGQEQVTIQSRRIENRNEISQELSRGDGHSVAILIRPLDGQILHKLPEAPHLPTKPWNSNIQALVDLEQELDTRLVNRYHALAAATLEGLSEAEKATVTARIDFDDEFVVNDISEE